MARRRALTPGDSPADSEHQSATAIIGTDRSTEALGLPVPVTVVPSLREQQPHSQSGWLTQRPDSELSQGLPGAAPASSNSESELEFSMSPGLSSPTFREGLAVRGIAS